MVNTANTKDYITILGIVSIALLTIYMPIMNTEWYAYLTLLAITLLLPTGYMLIKYPHVRTVLHNPIWAIWVFLLVMIFEYGGSSIWWFHLHTTTAYFILGILYEEWLFMFLGPLTCVVLYKAGTGE